MDNYVKDYKNHHLSMFLSLLIAKEVFKEVQLGFLVIGHTHEDIDENFGHSSKKLRKLNNYVIANFMKAVIFSHDHPFTPQLI